MTIIINNTSDKKSHNPDAQKVAIFSCKYFSTIGYTISSFRNSLNNETEIVTNDIFKAITNSTNNDARMRFYKGLIDGLINNFPRPSSSSISSTCSQSQPSILESLNVIEIENL